jgi:hypothetical protein
VHVQFINAALDIFEKEGSDFEVVQWVISPNRTERASNVSRAVIRVSVAGQKELAALFTAVNTLAQRMPAAAAKMVQLQFDQQTSTYSGIIDQRNNVRAWGDEPST